MYKLLNVGNFQCHVSFQGVHRYFFIVIYIFIYFIYLYTYIFILYFYTFIYILYIFYLHRSAMVMVMMIFCGGHVRICDYLFQKISMLGFALFYPCCKNKLKPAKSIFLGIKKSKCNFYGNIYLYTCSIYVYFRENLLCWIFSSFKPEVFFVDPKSILPIQMAGTRCWVLPDGLVRSESQWVEIVTARWSLVKSQPINRIHGTDLFTIKKAGMDVSFFTPITDP